MFELLHTIVAFIVALGILVTFHEFGHYWVARRMGVKILRFSVGFGRPLMSLRRGADQTEFTVAALPLGGYVKMLDEREGPVDQAELHRAFNRQPLGPRAAIVVAGPAANFLFAVFAYWLMFMAGVSGPKPLIDGVDPGSLAAAAGLGGGQEIVAVDGEATPTWDNVFRLALNAIIDGRKVEMTVREGSGFDRAVILDLSGVRIDDLSEGNFFGRLGIEPLRADIPAVIGRLSNGQPGAEAGLRAGDRIVRADGERIEDWVAWVEYVQARPGDAITVTVDRGGERLDLNLTPRPYELTRGSETQTIGRIGAEVAREQIVPPPSGIERYGPVSAVGMAVARTGDMTMTTLKLLGKMLVGEASVKNLSGPISIANFAGESAKLGFAWFLNFLGLVSVSLAVLNLLPIPLLDGGHLLYYLIEFVTRRPVPETVQMAGTQIGLVMLLSLMAVAVCNDIMRFL